MADNAFHLTHHDEPEPDDLAVVDHGLGEANRAAAPLGEVRPLACFIRLASGEVVGGVVARTWGHACEIQQVYVHPDYRRRGIATKLLQELEALAAQRGCHLFFLESFNFQAPELYQLLGYQVVHEHACYPHGIVKYLMQKPLTP